MNKYFLVLIFLLLSTMNCLSQNNLFFKDGKNYKATPILEFICDDYVYDNILKVQIAKTPKGGILKLAIKTSGTQVKIGDKVLLILKNGAIIHCLDKNLNDATETESIVYYLLSNLEMLQLKKQNIENIRFRIIGKTSRFGSPIGHFTANNKDTNFSLDKNLKSKYDTVSEIKLLN